MTLVVAFDPILASFKPLSQEPRMGKPTVRWGRKVMGLQSAADRQTAEREFSYGGLFV